MALCIVVFFNKQITVNASVLIISNWVITCQRYQLIFLLCELFMIFSGSVVDASGESEVIDTSMIHWPFVIVGSFSIFASLLLAFLLCLPFHIPVFEETRKSQVLKEVNGSGDFKESKLADIEGQLDVFSIGKVKSYSFEVLVER